MKTSDRDILKGYYWNHDAIRKDVQRLRTAILKCDQFKPADFKKIHEWFIYHEECILNHHHGEDDFFFPVMKERKPQFKTELEAMEHEHANMDESLEKLNTIFESLANGDNSRLNDLKEEGEKYARLVVRHLDAEERIVESVVSDIPKPEIMKVEDDYRATMSRAQMGLIMPWIMDAMDEKDQKFFMGMLPFIARWVYRISARPRFEKLCSCVE